MAHAHPPAAEAPVAVFLSRDGAAPEWAGRLERAGFRIALCEDADQAWSEAKRGAALCDPAALAAGILSQLSIEELIRLRLGLMLERIGSEPIADLHALVMREVERGLFTLVLERCRGNKGEAARQLGLHRNTLRQRLCELDLGKVGARKPPRAAPPRGQTKPLQRKAR